MTQTHEEFTQRMGAILLGALGVESQLEFFIVNYFVKPQDGKTFFLNDVIVHKIPFERKAHVFREICKREGFDQETLRAILADIDHVREVRNKVAHWQAESDQKETRLRKRTSRTTAEDVMRLDERTMNDFEAKRLAAVQGIIAFYMKYQKEGTKEERGVVEIF